MPRATRGLVIPAATRLASRKYKPDTKEKPYETRHADPYSAAVRIFRFSTKEAHMMDLNHCLRVLRALGITEVAYELDGSGDSGTAQLSSVTDRDGNTTNSLPAVTVGFTNHGGPCELEAQLIDLVYDIPEGDWINNEGGYGTVILRPQADPGEQVECQMTFRDEGDADQDFDDREDFIELASSDDPDVDPPDETATIDDSILPSTKGEPT